MRIRQPRLPVGCWARKPLIAGALCFVLAVVSPGAIANEQGPVHLSGVAYLANLPALIAVAQTIDETPNGRMSRP